MEEKEILELLRGNVLNIEFTKGKYDTQYTEETVKEYVDLVKNHSRSCSKDGNPDFNDKIDNYITSISEPKLNKVKTLYGKEMYELLKINKLLSKLMERREKIVNTLHFGINKNKSYIDRYEITFKLKMSKKHIRFFACNVIEFKNDVSYIDYNGLTYYHNSIISSNSYHYRKSRNQRYWKIVDGKKELDVLPNTIERCLMSSLYIGDEYKINKL